MSDLFFGNLSSKRSHDIYLASISDQKEYVKNNFMLGDNTTRILFNDSKLLGFMIARHKFVAKMFEGYKNVLEIGCQEGFGSMIVAPDVENMVAIDFYKPYIDSCLNRIGINIDFRGYDIIDGPIKENFDGIFAMDVIEHIDQTDETKFMENVVESLQPHGAFIVGSPSLESQQYASKSSKIGHINCKTGKQLFNICKNFFHNVFMFGMNDEVLHTGFLPMAHYIIALCTGVKKTDK